jgi:carbonic anhydrase/acetyltransferase-like protein (isoleucine patch superfamily)
MTQFKHLGHAPVVDVSSWLATTAVVCGDVRIGADCAVCHGAVLDAGDGTIEIGRGCVVMENVVLKASRRAPLRVGNHVLVGPRAYLSGCTVEDEVFLATGCTVFNLATIGRRAEVRINAVVHLRTRIVPGATVPIGWVAVGDPAEILPPDRHDRIWEIQEALDFPRVVFGLARPSAGETIMPELTRRYAAALRRHAEDKPLPEPARRSDRTHK